MGHVLYTLLFSHGRSHRTVKRNLGSLRDCDGPAKARRHRLFSLARSAMSSSSKKRPRRNEASAFVRSHVSEACSIESCLKELEELAGVRESAAPQKDTDSIVLAATNNTKEIRSKKRSFASSEIGDNPEPPSLSKLWDPSLQTTPIAGANDEVRDRALKWNTSMKTWMTRGVYTPGLLPSFQVEVSRHIQVETLSTYFLEQCPNLRMPSFERWLIDANFEERRSHCQASVDPVLSHCHKNSPACQRLGEEMRASGVDSSQVSQILTSLCRRAEVAISELEAQSVAVRNKVPFRKGERVDLVRTEGSPSCSLVYYCKRWKEPFRIKISCGHYDKLHEQFLRVHNHSTVPPLRLSEDGKPTKVMHCFHYLAMTVVVRYSALSGGQLLRSLRGGGMQGAVNGELFNVLNRLLRHKGLFECFASPLNAYLSAYGSAFFDLDWHFGSVGDFTQLSFTSGCCEANPPFSPALMDAMVDKIEASISEANKCKLALSFVVIVPAVSEDVTHSATASRYAASSFRRMVDSPAQCHLRLPAKDHGYVEGAQHLRPTRYKASLFDTSIILLQSQRAFHDPLPAKFEEEVRAAMRNRHAQETKYRQNT
jgi:Phosphorylated CTD interacting factor 1 WW domain